MDIAARLEQLEGTIKQAKSMPLSSSVLVNREEVLEMVTDMQAQLPEEIKQARWVVRDREELLAKARRDAEAMVEQARADQLSLAKKEEVVSRANEEAKRILAEAREEVRRLKIDADDYVDARLSQFEVALGKLVGNLNRLQKAVGRTADHVEQGRRKMAGPAHLADTLPSEDEDPAAESQPFDMEST